MRDLILALIVFGSIPVVLVKPHIGVLMWSWLGYMSPHQYTWTYSQEIRFSLIIAVVSIIAWLISHEPKRIPWNTVTLLLVAFTAWISFTTLFALNPEEGYPKWENTMKIVVMNGFVTLALLRTRSRLNALIWVIVVSIGYYGVKGGVFTLLTGGWYRVHGAPESFLGSENYVAAALLIVLPLMRYLQLNTQMRLIRWGLLAAMPLCVVAILGSQSRGGFIGLLIVLLVLFVKTRRKLLIGLGGALILALGINFMPERWHDRMETIITYQEDGSAQGRLRSWAFALDTALRHPVVGGGFGAFEGNLLRETVDRSTAAHSIYFEVLGEHGFVGLTLYLLLGTATFMMGASISRRARDHDNLTWARDLARMTQTSLVAFAVTGTFANFAYFDLAYNLIAIMVLVDMFVRDELAKSAPAKSERTGRTAVASEERLVPSRQR